VKESLGLIHRSVSCLQEASETEFSVSGATEVADGAVGDPFWGLLAGAAVVALEVPALAWSLFGAELALAEELGVVVRGLGAAAVLVAFFADILFFGALTSEEAALELAVELGTAFF